MVFCSNCGHDAGNSKFCSNCGARVKPLMRVMDQVYPDIFSPSELLVLLGDKFVQKGMIGNTQMLYSGEPVSTANLVKMALIAGIFSCEKNGEISLVENTTKGTFGLGKKKVLNIVPKTKSDWPEYSFEDSIYNMVSRFESPQRLFYEWIEQDSMGPWDIAIEKIYDGLSKRGLLEYSEEKSMGIFTSKNYALKDDTREQLTSRDISPLKSMLDTCRISRKNIWDLLEQGLNKAIQERQD